MRPHPTRSIVQSLSWLVAVLGIVGQLLIGAAIPAQAMFTGGGPPDGVPICHTAGLDDLDTRAPAGHPAHHRDCALCPVCQVPAVTVALPAPSSFPPLPSIAVVAQAAPLPPARSPHGGPKLAAIFPTGPPHLA